MRVKLNDGSNIHKLRQGFTPECEWLGSVTDDYGNSGSLMRVSFSGKYFLVRGNGRRELDAQAVALAIAEAMAQPQTGPGRPRMYRQRQTRLEVNLPAWMVPILREHGAGNASEGIRRLILSMLEASGRTDEIGD